MQLKSASGQVKALLPRLDLAKLRVRQNKELVATGAGDRFSLEQAEANVIELEGQLATAQANEAQVSQKLSGKANGELATVAAARAQLAVAQAQVDQSRADLAKARECMSCHALDKEVVGPAFKSVAKKYKGKAQAEDMLVKTVVKGSPDAGGFHWGTKKMPSPGARVAVSEDEARVLVRWVLAQ